MAQKRLRIFGGPNGSGKSTLLKRIPPTVPLGYYINADEIEKLIESDEAIYLLQFGIKADTKVLHQFFDRSEFVQNKSDASRLKKYFKIQDNYLGAVHSDIPVKYSAAIIAEFLREQNLIHGNDFSFETVMSHPNKIEFIKRANKKGYHVYLYFVCIDDVRVNIERVKTRVKEGGHPVPESKIKERYLRTLNLLYDAPKLCYKSYLFDNSDQFKEIARINRDKTLSITGNSLSSNWFFKYVVSKHLKQMKPGKDLT